jgi:two-component system, cell cycle sensor histidine kinase and response regulator CckA
MSAFDIRPPEHHARLTELMVRAAEVSRRVFRTEHLRRDGSRVPVEVSTHFIREQEVFVSIVRDITERRAAENRIRSLNRLLRTRSAVDEAIVRESEEAGLLKALCEKACAAGELHSVWIGRAEPDGRVTVAARAGRPLGYITDGAIRWDTGPTAVGPGGRSIRERRTITVDDVETDPAVATLRSQILAAGARSIASTPLVVHGRPFGFIAFLASEPHVFEGDVLGLIETLGGDIGYALEVIEDRSARRDLEDQLRQAQKMEAVGRLAGGIAHDFNNLLTVILGNCGEALDTLARDDPRRQNIAGIEEAAHRAATLTRQLLAFSRRQILRPEIIDLNDVVRKITGLLRRLIGEDVKLVTELEAGPAEVLADPGQVEQVLLNLAINSRDAMPHGGTLTLRTGRMDIGPQGHERDAAMEPGPHVCLVVSDTGAGMSDEVKAHIFEPFFTTKDVGKGTGLGLSTVYGIVRQSRGGIFFDSTPGGGTTFTIALPAVEPESAVATPPRTRPDGSEQGVECVLLAEDEPGVRSLARRALTSAGYGVLEAASGEEALMIAASHSRDIAVLITDVVMPGLTGPELAARVKSVRPDIKILYTSGYAETAVLGGIKSGRGTAFLQKPFTIPQLRACVRELIDTL